MTIDLSVSVCPEDELDSRNNFVFLGIARAHSGVDCERDIYVQCTDKTVHLHRPGSGGWFEIESPPFAMFANCSIWEIWKECAEKKRRIWVRYSDGSGAFVFNVCPLDYSLSKNPIIAKFPPSNEDVIIAKFPFLDAKKGMPIWRKISE